jgi:hypothetical protein
MAQPWMGTNLVFEAGDVLKKVQDRVRRERPLGNPFQFAVVLEFSPGI